MACWAWHAVNSLLVGLLWTGVIAALGSIEFYFIPRHKVYAERFLVYYGLAVSLFELCVFLVFRIVQGCCTCCATPMRAGCRRSFSSRCLYFTHQFALALLVPVCGILFGSLDAQMRFHILQPTEADAAFFALLGVALISVLSFFFGVEQFADPRVGFLCCRDERAAQEYQRLIEENEGRSQALTDGLEQAAKTLAANDTRGTQLRDLLPSVTSTWSLRGRAQTPQQRPTAPIDTLRGSETEPPAPRFVSVNLEEDAVEMPDAIAESPPPDDPPLALSLDRVRREHRDSKRGHGRRHKKRSSTLSESSSASKFSRRIRKED